MSDNEDEGRRPPFQQQQPPALNPQQQVMERLALAMEEMTTLQQVAVEATRVAQGVAQAPRPAPRKTPTLDVVDPIEWMTFRRAFEITHRINMWDDVRGRQELAAAMEKEAARVTSHVNPQDLNLLQMLQQYEALFVTRAASEAAKTAFHQTKQAAGETLLAYHSRLRDLYIRAYPGNDAEASEILRRQFIFHLRDARISDWANMQRPQTYQAALAAAEDRAAGLMALPSHKGVDYIGAMGAGSAVNVECYNCQKVGHYKRDCPQASKGGRGRGKGRGRGRGRGGRGERGGAKGGKVNAVGNEDADAEEADGESAEN